MQLCIIVALGYIGPRDRLTLDEIGGRVSMLWRSQVDDIGVFGRCPICQLPIALEVTPLLAKDACCFDMATATQSRVASENTTMSM